MSMISTRVRGCCRVKQVNITKIPRWEARIRASLNTFSSAEQKVAHCVLSSPETLLQSGIQQLAKASGVSEASVVRFCRCLGYTGLKEFKLAVAQEQMVDDDSSRVERCLESADTAKAIKQKVFYGCMEALQDTLSVVDDRALAQAIDILYHAPYIDVFGVGGSASVARSALHSFRRIGLRMHITTDFENGYLNAERFYPGDTVLAISLSGETPPVVQAARSAKSRGATVVCITNVRGSSLSQLADCCLVSASRTRMMPGDETYERVAQIAIIHAIYAGVAMKLREEEELAEHA